MTSLFSGKAGQVPVTHSTLSIYPIIIDITLHIRVHLVRTACAPFYRMPVPVMQARTPGKLAHGRPANGRTSRFVATHALQDPLAIRGIDAGAAARPAAAKNAVSNAASLELLSFVSWAINRKIKFGGVRPEVRNGIRGVFATAPLSASDVVLAVPEQVALTVTSTPSQTPFASFVPQVGLWTHTSLPHCF